MTVQIITGDCRDVLRSLPAESVHTVCTSPPYWGLRDYGVPSSIWGGDSACDHEWGAGLRRHKGGPHGNGAMLAGGRAVVEAQASCKDIDAGAFCAACGAWRGAHGLEPSFDLYVDHAVMIFREVRRVLRDDGSLWLNLGDSYATGAGKVGQGARWAGNGKTLQAQWKDNVSTDEMSARGNPSESVEIRALPSKSAGFRGAHEAMGPMTQPNRMPQADLKPKDLVGIPWRVAFALQADGWYLRQDIIWSKPNPMPESVRDRCTKAHEYLFLLSKSEKYYYDADAIRQEPTGRTDAITSFGNVKENRPVQGGRDKSGGGSELDGLRGANRRSVWEIATQPYSDAHFATFPPALGGAGTTGLVADRLQRNAILIELNPEYAAMARRRIDGDAPLLSYAEAAE